VEEHASENGGVDWVETGSKIIGSAEKLFGADPLDPDFRPALATQRGANMCVGVSAADKNLVSVGTTDVFLSRKGGMNGNCSSGKTIFIAMRTSTR
jgi:hypothetical protein